VAEPKNGSVKRTKPGCPTKEQAMSHLERSLAHASSNVKYRKPRHDLEAAISFALTDYVTPDGLVYPAHYRGRYHARRHILMDTVIGGLRVEYHRAYRRWAKADAAERLADALAERNEP
jgi:hypothetical protein